MKITRRREKMEEGEKGGGKRGKLKYFVDAGYDRGSYEGL
jgi:hypothetical protein